MKPYVIIATKGRAGDVHELLSWLAQQARPAEHIVVVGADASDVAGLDRHDLVLQGGASLVVTGRAGLTLQRNAGVRHLREFTGNQLADSFVVFFDDDFRPAPDWLACAAGRFESEPALVGLTGHVLADGVHGDPLTSTDAQTFIEGQRTPRPHWASGAVPRHLDSLYGCNMAFRHTVIESCEFDECLPFYGWQEDQDYTGQAARLGQTLYVPDCRGVHLGSRSGRTSGVRFGYSQVANPIYLTHKGTMPRSKATRFIAKHLIANLVKGARVHPSIDYRGRMKGNWLALLDLLRLRCHPMRVTSLG